MLPRCAGAPESWRQPTVTLNDADKAAILTFAMCLVLVQWWDRWQVSAVNATLAHDHTVSFV